MKQLMGFISGSSANLKRTILRDLFTHVEFNHVTYSVVRYHGMMTRKIDLRRAW
jgi:hypothetical protein